jgi:hypothetical protein
VTALLKQKMMMPRNQKKQVYSNPRRTKHNGEHLWQ